MDANPFKELIAAGDMAGVETAWMQIAEGTEPVAPAIAREVVEALASAGQAELAETLGWALLEERRGRTPSAEALGLAKAMAQAVPGGREIRQQLADLYRAAFGRHQHFEVLLRVSDLLGAATPRRAMATLDLCLRIAPGDYVANRFHNQVLAVRAFDAATAEYELDDLAGGRVRLDPRKLADEFDRIEETDFRVVSRRDPQRLAELLESDPAAVLIGICQSRDGQIDSVSLKGLLVPRHMAKDQWSDWWGRARAAAKRCDKLVLAGRNPFLITYHRHGLTLEDELSGEAAAARTPPGKLELLRRYIREARRRGLTPKEEFTAPIVESLAEQARAFAAYRPADALAAALAIDAAGKLGLAAPKAEGVTAEAVLAEAPQPARAVADLADDSLWPAALEALGRRPDAAEQFVALLDLAPVDQLDAVASAVRRAGRGETIAAAAGQALADPLRHVDLCLWLWAGPAEPVEGVPGRLEILGRLLRTMQDIDHDMEMSAPLRKDFQRRVRSALAARQYAAFRQAVAEMDEATASTVRNRIERMDGLAESVHDELLNILRESFYQIFVKARVEPWLNENVIWTTEAALHRCEADLKELIEVRIPANSRAIEAAVAHGDLSENSEWKYAIEERNTLQQRQAKMQADLGKARIFRPEDVPGDLVGIGSRVRLRRLEDGQELELSLLGPWDTDLARRRYSYLTPLARGLLGAPVGQTVTLKIDGAEGRYRIESVGPGEL